MNKVFLLRATVFFAIALGIFYLGQLLYATAPSSKKQRPEPLKPVVDVIKPAIANSPLSINAHGNVIAAKRLPISTQIGGKITYLHPLFEAGGVIPANDEIFTIDPSDYQLAIAQARAQIQKAQAAIQLERGRGNAAEKEIKLLGNKISLSKNSREITLRKPQLLQSQAELAIAKQQLKQAQLDLSRSKLSLPYDVIVLERSKVTDEVVAPRDTIGTVTQTTQYWLELKISPKFLIRLKTRNPQQMGSLVTINHNEHHYQGEVIHLKPELSKNSRLASVIVAISDPLSLLEVNSHRPPLLLGSYVAAEINAGTLEASIKLPSHAVRNNNRILVADSNSLFQVRNIKVLWRSEEFTYIEPSLKEGDSIIVSPNQALIAGTPISPRNVVENK